MKQIYFWITMVALFLGSFAQAQTGVTVTYYDGNVQQFSVADSGKLYFSDDNLNIKADTSATPTTIPVGIIRKITFSETLSTIAIGANSAHLALYPNPGSETIRIHSDNLDMLSVRVYSLHGQLVQQGNYQPNQAIDVSGLSSGLYIVQVNDATLKFSKK